ncbi:GNAT family N-acetyltransferase [Micromonospora radicis]|uniref:GNAT family N-acetyltransferase n=1 Tax=Micromonospora radicis TaxID=1894971 RepID=A0A418MXG5_9ACTN|nr:GNAT family N-acetyltransferase [Micromonospora radicis]RIV39728.1 GNAT family N-acetyltransferase [Micromonospora radicis]
MQSTEVRVATPADRPQVVAGLVAAFVGDPVLRHLFPDPADYPRFAAAFFGHLFDRRVGLGTVWTIGPGASTAMWQPPTTEGHADDDLRAALPADALARMRAYDEAVHDALPTEPYWYLGVLGTRPDRAGRRFGRTVMSIGLGRAAAEGLPAVLETSNPANVEFYRRAGWQVVHTVDDPLPIWVLRQ